MNRIAVVSRIVLILSGVLLVASCGPLPTATTPARVEPTLPPAQNVTVAVQNDVYILPVAELQTTTTNPDIVWLENEYVKISVVANRGRPIFSYLFKPTGNEALYSNYRPRPVKTPAGYVVEFGGYYLSPPWNVRDRQPYDLEYEITQKGPEVGEVHLWGTDPIHHARTDMWVVLRQNTSRVQINVKISNETSDEITFDIRDYAVFAPGGELTPASRLVIPTAEITLGPNQDDWMGQEGEKKPWPQPWAEWGNFQRYGSFQTDVRQMDGAFVAVINPDTNDTLVKVWDPPDRFDKLDVWSWGTAYEEVSGGTPTVTFENSAGPVSLAPGASLTFSVSFYAVEGLTHLTQANADFAGWLATDKSSYDRATDQAVRVSGQFGASRNYHQVEVRATLATADGEAVREIAREQIAALAPGRPYHADWTVDLDEALKPGRYVVHTALYEVDNKLFDVTSSPFEVK